MRRLEGSGVDKNRAAMPFTAGYVRPATGAATTGEVRITTVWPDAWELMGAGMMPLARRLWTAAINVVMANLVPGQRVLSLAPAPGAAGVRRCGAWSNGIAPPGGTYVVRARGIQDHVDLVLITGRTRSAGSRSPDWDLATSGTARTKPLRPGVWGNRRGSRPRRPSDAALLAVPSVIPSPAPKAGLLWVDRCAGLTTGLRRDRAMPHLTDRHADTRSSTLIDSTTHFMSLGFPPSGESEAAWSRTLSTGLAWNRWCDPAGQASRVPA
jgi:hypothetical protein